MINKRGHYVMMVLWSAAVAVVLLMLALSATWVYGAEPGPSGYDCPPVITDTNKLDPSWAAMCSGCLLAPTPTYHIPVPTVISGPTPTPGSGGGGGGVLTDTLYLGDPIAVHLYYYGSGSKHDFAPKQYISGTILNQGHIVGWMIEAIEYEGLSTPFRKHVNPAWIINIDQSDDYPSFTYGGYNDLSYVLTTKALVVTSNGDDYFDGSVFDGMDDLTVFRTSTTQGDYKLPVWLGGLEYTQFPVVHWRMNMQPRISTYIDWYGNLYPLYLGIPPDTGPEPIDCTVPVYYDPADNRAIIFDPPDYTSTNCIVVIPAFEVIIPTIGDWNGWTFGVPKFEVCIDYYTLPVVEIVGYQLPLHIIFVPVVIFLIGLIVRL